MFLNETVRLYENTTSTFIIPHRLVVSLFAVKQQSNNIHTAFEAKAQHAPALDMSNKCFLIVSDVRVHLKCVC